MNKSIFIFSLALLLNNYFAYSQQDTAEVNYSLGKFVLSSGDTIASLAIIAVHDNSPIPKSDNMPENSRRIGYTQDIDIDFFEIATKVDMHKDSVCYILHVKGINMPRAGISVITRLSPTATILTYPIENKEAGREYDFTMVNDLTHPFPLGFRGYNEFIIKFIDHKKNYNLNSIQIKNIVHIIFLSFLEDASNNYYKRIPDSDGLSLKSDPQCGYLPCLQGYESWNYEYLGIFRYYYTVYIDGFYTELYGSGFLLNSGDNYGYDLNAKPFGITSAHVFSDAVNDGYTIETVLSLYSDFLFHQRRNDCIQPGETDGVTLSGADFVASGNYNHASTDLQSGDYVVFKLENNLKALKNNGITLLGWDINEYTSNDDMYNMMPYFVFGFPEAVPDIRYAKSNYYMPAEPDFYRANMVEGFIYPGNSGSAFLNKNRQVLGVAVRATPLLCAGSAECVAVKLSKIFDEVPDLKSAMGDNLKAVSFDPGLSNLKANCTNCKKDADLGETGIDCGGSCLPCGINEHTAGYVHQGGSTPHVLSVNGNITYQSGSDISVNSTATSTGEIIFYNNVDFGNGARFKTAATVNDVYPPLEGCQILCPPTVTNIARWDPSTDVSLIMASDYTDYDFELWDLVNVEQIAHTSGSVVPDEYDECAIWNTSNRQHIDPGSAYVLHYILDLTDCHGNIINDITGFIHVYP